MSQEQDKIFFRNFSLVVGGIAVIMVLFFIVAQFAGTDEEAEAKMRASKVAKMTEPVGQVVAVGEETAEEAAPPTASGDVGKTVYDGLCVNCHGIPAMAAMIPQTGDNTAWVARIEQGADVLYDHAINGYVGEMGMMPAKGGNPDLSDDEVKAAVDYIVGQTQGADAASSESASTDNTADAGKKVYDGLCVNCHGVTALAAMIPQTGDATAWAARIEKGKDALYENAINGFVGELGMMPGKGGNLDLSDDEVKAAVDYMLGQVQ